MKFRLLLLTGAVLPFALIQSGVADESIRSPRLILAQADEPCPPGTECPPPQDAAPAEPEQAAPEAVPEQPAPEAAPEQPAEQAAPEQPVQEPAAEQPVQEAAPEQPVEQPQQAEQPPAEAPAEEPVQEAAPEQPAQEPAQDQPVQEAAPEQPADEPAEEQPQQAEQPQEPAQDQPVQEAAPEQPAAEPSQEQPVQEAAPAAEPPAAGDAVERAQRRREELRRRGDAPQEPQQAEQPAGDAPAQEQQQADQPAEGQPAADAAATEDDTVEQQLEAQGDDEEADSVRNLREQLLEQLMQTVAPSDENEADGNRRDRDGGDRARGDRRDGDRDQAGRDGRDRDRDGRGRWDRDRFYDRDEDRGEVVEERGGRIIIDLGGGNLYVQPDVPDEGGRLLYGADDVEVRNLRGGRTETTVYRRNGVQIVTVRDRYGDIIRRTKVLPDGREVVLFDNRYEEDGPRRPIIVDVRPPRIDIPDDRYIVDLGGASDDDIREALTAPPVQRLERSYTLDEVLRNEQIRAYSPRIDLDTITFDFGSATIGNNQMDALLGLGDILEEVIADNPDEVYLIEGHTDLVGSDTDNLILSDQRAEAVAVALSQNFDIPPENLVTEGYGEQYPKVDTEEPERLNRRVTVRRLTDLMAQN